MNFFWNVPLQVNFEDVQKSHKSSGYMIINTLPVTEQSCLILHSVLAKDEESSINDMIHDMAVPDRKIIVYGKNCLDLTVDKKISQLQSLGLKQIYIYRGGMFEWMLLQDIYGFNEFPTTQKAMDILQFAPKPLKN